MLAKLNGRIVTPNEPQNEPQNEHQNEATLGKAHRKMVVGFANCGLDRRQIKDYI